MRVRFEKRDDKVLVYPDAGAEVLEDFLEDLPPDFLHEALEAARAPENAPDDDFGLGWSGNHTRCWMRRTHVVVSNDFTDETVTLDHKEFIEIIEGYLALRENSSDASISPEPGQSQATADTSRPE